MPIYLLLRLVSILGVVLAVKIAPPLVWLTIVYIFGFTHYIMGAIYSRRQVREAYGQPLSLIPLLALIVFGTGLYSLRFPLLIYFGLHHAFNEAYVLKETTPSDEPAVSALRSSAFMLHLFLYFVLLRRPQSMGIMEANIASLIIRRAGHGLFNEELLWTGLVLSYGFFFYYLWQIKSSLRFKTLIDNCSFEILGLVAVAVSYYVNFKFLEVVFYHFVFWTLYPMVKMRAPRGHAIAAYLGLTAVFTGVFVLLSPLGGTIYGFSLVTYQWQFTIWSYIHITASLMLSNANPAWIVGLFRPASSARTAVVPSSTAVSEVEWEPRKIAGAGRG
jgi:hypothetical protein